MKRRTNPARAARAALVLCLLGCSITGSSQGLNNLWTGGYASWAPPPSGGVDLNFQGGNVSITSLSRDVNYQRTVANICDQGGSLLFSTNGLIVANALGDTMLNGSGLNPGNYADNSPYGLLIVQGALILPRPDAPSEYYIFHMTVDDEVVINAEQLYLTTIDMSLDGGLGGVVSKNQVILSDDLNLGYLTAVRHANGRDWWIFCHKLNTNLYYRWLATPQGVSLDGTQSIGTVRPADNGQACFSPDGNKFAYYWGEQDLDIFDFDRCTGLFNAPVFVSINDYNGAGGVAFSPNGRFVYVSSTFDVYQFDTEAADIGASMVHIAEWDSTYSPSPPFATLFNIAQLAPDGKIYISTDNTTLVLHMINDPDSAGIGCNMVQHGIALPRYFGNSLPNHPNYHLGPVDGTVCDSLGINVGIFDQGQPVVVQAFPNPTTGQFTLSYSAQSVVGELELRDLAGRIVRRESIPQWSTVHRVAIDQAAGGLYMCKIRWQGREAVVRIIVVE
jgi:hypothetical protein